MKIDYRTAKRLTGRYSGVLLSPEILLVVAVAAFAVLVAVIEWRRRDRRLDMSGYSGFRIAQDVPVGH